MAQLSFRENVLFKVNSSDSTRPDFGDSYDVTAYPVGAVVRTAQTSTTINVDAGHSFRVGDKFLLSAGGANTYSADTVFSVTATTIVMTLSFTVVVGDTLVNLGPDTGATSPNFDASPLIIYSDADGSTAISNSRVTATASGEYSYYHKGSGRFWELVRDGSSVVVDVIKGFGAYPGVYNVSDYGAVGDGVANDHPSFDAAVTAAEESGGIVQGNPADIYKLNTNVTVSASNVTVDMRGARLMGSNTRFIFDGDSETDGDRSSVLSNVHFKNAVIGDGTTATRGPRLFWCDDSSIENVVKDGPSGTAFNVEYCKRCLVRNVINIGGIDSGGGAIGLLILHSEDTVVDNFHVDGEATDPFLVGVQVKGGFNNLVMNSSLRRVIDGASVESTDGFRDRGDTPYGASSTTGTYPYSSGAWGSADAARESHDTRFVNCVVGGSSEFGTDFIAQEAVGTQFIGCHSDGAESTSFGIFRITSGTEKNYVLRDCVAENSGNVGFHVRGISGNRLPGVVIDNCRADTCGKEGFRVETATDAILLNCTSRNNGQDTADTFDGIDALSDNLRLRVHYALSYDDQGTPTQRRGVHIRSGNTNTIVKDCYLDSNVTAELTDSGTTSTVRNNVGHVTENSGTATILSTTTSIAVTHGLGVTPAVGDIMVIPVEDPTNTVSYWWVDTLTSTQFTINVDADPGASNLDFAWRTIVL